MKNTFINIFIFFILIIGIRASGQEIKSPQFKGGEITLRSFLVKRFGEEAKKRDLNVCMISAVFAKFTVDSTGNVKNLTFSQTKETPYIFKELLTSVIMATNGLWMPCKINGKAVDSKPFILPLIYEMEAGCNPQKVVSADVKTNYKPIPNGTATDLLYILDYDDNGVDSISQLDCIILKPLRVFSQN